MNGYFQWDAARLSLQIQEMDDEHKVLIALMNKLHSLHEAGAPMGEQGRTLDELISYTRKHFAAEEVYMEKIGFPGIRIHKGVHTQLLDKLAGFQQAFRSSNKLPEDLFIFFKMWLSAHICGIDIKYAQHAKARRSA